MSPLHNYCVNPNYRRKVLFTEKNKHAKKLIFSCMPLAQMPFAKKIEKKLVAMKCTL